ncbi:MAG TPA: hypothetical protein VL202_08740 [Pararhizobium sp.]|uniref:hypothetical protein n=1 Tax=Pararhizobium sp. TaxID=1977563 RepID=UPI002C67ED45|nr:hypothetical protein [Pararhizobium sp.]HTO31249.1 hypothetical protein [Pararhizobium sp.]
MVPALIIMTILGCDDNVTQCHYVSTVSGTWATIATCDAESQKQLPKFSNSNYPVIVAVCETSDKQMAKAEDPAASTNADPLPMATPQAQADTIPTPPATQEQPSLPRRTLAPISGTIPDTAKLRQTIAKPVHYIEDGYSWVARKFTR